MKLLSRDFLTQYTFTAVVFLSVDLLWIFLFAGDLYQKTLSPILAPQPGWIPALAFYLLYPFCLWFLAIKASTKPENAALRGAVVGLCAYGTYALTGQSLFAGWQWSLTIADCVWGTALSAGVAYLTSRYFPR